MLKGSDWTHFDLPPCFTCDAISSDVLLIRLWSWFWATYQYNQWNVVKWKLSQNYLLKENKLSFSHCSSVHLLYVENLLFRFYGRKVTCIRWEKNWYFDQNRFSSLTWVGRMTFCFFGGSGCTKLSSWRGTPLSCCAALFRESGGLEESFDVVKFMFSPNNWKSSLLPEFIGSCFKAIRTMGTKSW